MRYLLALLGYQADSPLDWAQRRSRIERAQRDGLSSGEIKPPRVRWIAADPRMTQLDYSEDPS